MHFFEEMRHEVARSSGYIISGEVSAIKGLAIEVAGISHHIAVGERCFLERSGKPDLPCEIIGVQKDSVIAMPFGAMEGIGVGNRVKITHSDTVIYPHAEWLGRTIDAFGQPLDDLGTLSYGDHAYPIHNSPPPAHQRRLIGEKLCLGVRAMDSFVPCCKGQRLGVFAGSGIGKSILMGMIARHSNADIIVVGLIGERGREVREFIENALGRDNMQRCVMVVSTSDEPALCRKQAAFTATTVAEYFRAQGKDVLLLLDSVTRFAMALREIGLSVGEPPTTKGYPPSVFTQLPKLLERAGPGSIKPNDEGMIEGNITAIFTVLVEGDDHNEPISDAIRSILDGHVMLSRDIAHRGRYPAIDVMKSVSRALPACNNILENEILQSARENIARYEEMADLISLGTYRKGSDKNIDRAIDLHPKLENFFKQDPDSKTTIEESFQQLGKILGMEYQTATNTLMEENLPEAQNLPQNKSQAVPADNRILN